MKLEWSRRVVAFAVSAPESARPVLGHLGAASALFIVLVATAWLGGSAESQPAAPSWSPKISLIDGSVDLAPHGKEGMDTLILLTTPSAATDAIPEVTETGPEGPTISFGKAAPFGRPSAGQWLLPVTVKGWTDETVQLRRLQVAAGTTTEVLDYTITNLPRGPFTWTVLPAGGSLSWSKDAPPAATVVVGATPATHVAAHAALVDDVTAASFGAGYLQVCRNRTGLCEEVDQLAANQSHRIFLRPPADAVIEPGKYSGTIELLAGANRSTPAAITLYVTDALHQGLGLAALGVGVLASLAFTLFVRNGLARAQLQRPAAVLRDALEDVHIPSFDSQKAAKTLARLKELKDRLSPASLEKVGLIPGRFDVSGGAGASPAYQLLLERAAGWIIALKVIGRGLEHTSLALGEPSSLDAAQLQTIKAARACIDKLSGEADPTGSLPEPPKPVDLEAAIDACAPKTGGQTFTLIRAGGGSLSAAEQVRFHITALSLVSWLAVAALSILIGSYFMVLGRLDFGRTQDFLFCLLWGFGFPTSATQLAQLAPSGIGSSLGVVLPK